MRNDDEVKLNADYPLHIKRVETLSLAQECLKLGVAKTANELYNKALELALPQLQEQHLSGTIPATITRIDKLETKILSKLTREFKGVKNELVRILILLQVNEDMTSSILQAIRYAATASGIPITNELLKTFSDALLPVFEEQKQYYIRELFPKANE